MTGSRQIVGRRGEQLARRHLESRGYVVLEANYRVRAGEIDLVTEKAGALVFVEVRSRTESGFGTPEESLTREKRTHLVSAAQEYLQTHEAEDRDWRIDLVSVRFGSHGEPPQIDTIENAVEL